MPSFFKQDRIVAPITPDSPKLPDDFAPLSLYKTASLITLLLHAREESGCSITDLHVAVASVRNPITLTGMRIAAGVFDEK